MNLLSEILEVAPAGFEPALPKETELKSVALDHSAIAPLFVIGYHCVEKPPLTSWIHTLGRCGGIRTREA